MIHERECSYCGTLAQWRAQDRIPLKCTSCGAPPHRVAKTLDDGPKFRVEVAYGLACLRTAKHPRLL